MIILRRLAAAQSNYTRGSPHADESIGKQLSRIARAALFSNIYLARYRLEFAEHGER